MIRRPTPLTELYAWHSAILAGHRPLTPVGEPQPGWFKRRLIKGGVFVPARIWLEQEIDEITGELMADERLLCEVAGERRDPDEEWTWLAGHPISEAEFDYMTATRSWAAWHAPNAPEANPRRALNHLTTPIRF